MAKKIIARKCFECKQEIEIDLNNIHDVVWCASKYYHKDCFIKKAEDIIANKGRSIKLWRERLQNVVEYEEQAKEKLQGQKQAPSDHLNDWILEHYDIISTAKFNNFWRSVTELEQGKYRKKRCKKVSTELLHEAWVWAQSELDKIATYNRSVNKIIEGEARLNYDLTIVVKMLPEFLKHKSKMQALTAETCKSMETKTKIDYSKLEVKKASGGMDDISDLLDELF